MNKSIYEEALEAYGHVNAIVQNKKSHLTWEEEVHHLANITRALQHAKKQEKVLKLYQKYYHDYDDLTMNEGIDILQQIRALENE